ncbi:MAG: penicillin acylase family protein [Syntrophaceae bacterium]|nr:penicillin acylase family protein [Syntrophaceae bacterium]
MKKIILIVVVLFVIIAGGIVFYLRSFLPTYEGKFSAPGLKSIVTIERNRFAVPTITASNMEDLFFAWGYVNAQDRLFQMEFTRRVAQGRISEFAGEGALIKDIFLRAVGFYRRALDYAAHMEPEFRLLYQRFTEGVNYYLETKGPNLYMKVLGMKKEKWDIADVVAIGVMLNWGLTYNLKHELLYQRIIKKIGKERATKLLNLLPADEPTIVDDRIASISNEESLAKTVAVLDWLMGCRSASNSWAIGPSKTTHGGTILCSDMQVHQSKMPNDFYLLRLRAGEFEATGAQVAGLPFIASGYNRHIAWGLTNQGADLVDLFMEKINWENKTYRYRGEDFPLESRDEVFTVKGKNPVKKKFYYAGGKPILNEVFSDLGFDVSLDWAGFDAIDIQGFLRINRARTWEDFEQAARSIRVAPQNCAYADDSGNIAYRVIGSLPLRHRGTGNLIQDGEKVRRNWNGNIPDDEYPSLKNPARSFIVTANNKNMRTYPYEMNGTYSPSYRYENIARMIRDKKGLDIEYMKKVQTDTFTVLADKIRQIIKKYVKTDGSDPQMQKALDLLTKWDGDIQKDAAAPSIYNTFYVRFAFLTLADELGDDLAVEYIGERYISMDRFFEMVDHESEFFDNVLTPETETISDIATLAFKETLSLLERYTGSNDPESWKWGKLHIIKFDHVLGKSALFRYLVNNGPFPFEGDGETNNRARFNEVVPPFVTDLASAPRIIVKFEPKPKAYMMLITGENEFFMSKHNADMTRAWLRKEYFCMEEEPYVYSLVMEPAKQVTK